MKQSRIFPFLISCLVLLALVTCGKDSPTTSKPQPQPPTQPPTQPPAPVVPTRVTIAPSSASLTSIGQTVQFSATVFDNNGAQIPGAAVTWLSDKPAVATVSPQGLVTAVMNGTAQITARAGNASASVTVTVAQSAVRITISPPSAALMAIGETVQLTATVLDQNGQPVEGAVVTWSSSDENVATVTGQGLVTAVMNGAAQITARAGTVSISIDVTVMQAPGSIVIEPEEATLMAIAETVQLTATVLDQNGEPVADAVATWSSSDEAVATVSPQGLVTAVMNGTTQITARSGNVSTYVTVQVTDMSRDRDALISLYHTTNGPNWTNSTNWMSDEPLATWHGVTTNFLGEVVRLVLEENNLVGMISVDLGQLQNLETLGLWNNQLTGGIPAEIGRLQKLSFLSLSNNQLTGSIPSELGQLQNLETLGLSNNQLTGSIPSELGQLQNLETLGLSNNQLTGSIPSELGQLQNLETLGLSNNQLTGSIPSELGQLENLRTLSVDANSSLSGAIPVELTTLTQLQHLYLRGTQTCIPPTTRFHQWLSGIPNKTVTAYCPRPERDALIALYDRTNGPSWTNNTNWLSFAPLGEWYGVNTDTDGMVTHVVLSDNNLSGSLPSQVGDLARLEVLNLSSNTRLSGTIPYSFTSLDLLDLNLEGTQVCAPFDPQFQEWLDDIPLQNVTNCTEMRRDYYPLAALYNSTNGPNWTNNTNWLSNAPLGDWYGVSTNSSGQVTFLDLGENSLDGVIPPDIGHLQSLKQLDLGENYLSGAIPLEIGLLQNLTRLSLWRNKLTGAIPSEIGLLENLTSLNLNNNKLSGTIPPEISQLSMLENLSLFSNELSGEIPPEIGQLKNLEGLGLILNQLTGVIPPEIGQLKNLRFLNLGENQLTGAIPSEIGQLQNLTDLWIPANRFSTIPPEIGQLQNLKNLELGGNQLTEIPTEIGQLQQLTNLGLAANQLSGEIPPEIGQLKMLESLILNSNELSGSIPPEIGQLRNLKFLALNNNLFTGISSEIGQLQNLEELYLHKNKLEGSIPSELGWLLNLEYLRLHENRLSGIIPPELGRLTKLKDLYLSYNQLTGNIPRSFGDLTSLQSLRLTDNAGMSGTLPLTLTRLNLEDLLLGGTRLCVTEDSQFQDWLRGVVNSRVARCAADVGRLTAYLTQATQSLEYPVPLVAGEDALLRVFISSESDLDAVLPPVRATFFQGDAEVYVVEIPSQGAAIPRQIEEGDLSVTANTRIPGSVLTPGLEMVIEIDPDGELDPALGISGRLPPGGRMPMDVVNLPPFELTLVPFLWTGNSDESYLSQISGLTAESDLFRLTRDILPVGDFVMNVYDPQWISVDPGWENHGELIRLTKIITAMEGGTAHYMGMLRNGGGWGERPGTASVANFLDGYIIAHELGHNLGLYHTTCGGATVPDPDFPYVNGSIGAWGYDLLNEDLVTPDTPDVMGYCRPRWISDYHFTKAMGYRLSQAQEIRSMAAFAPAARSLLLSGGVNEDGELVLEPAFVVDAPPSTPQLGGPYEITGQDQDGRKLFSMSFEMPEVEDAEGKAFAFIVPVSRDRGTRLHSITLSGPEGVSSLDGEDDPTAALLLDPGTGKVRGLLRDWPEPPTTLQAARRSSPEPGLEVVISRGVPEATDWDR